MVGKLDSVILVCFEMLVRGVCFLFGCIVCFLGCRMVCLMLFIVDCFVVVLVWCILFEGVVGIVGVEVDVWWCKMCLLILVVIEGVVEVWMIVVYGVIWRNFMIKYIWWGCVVFLSFCFGCVCEVKYNIYKIILVYYFLFWFCDGV